MAKQINTTRKCDWGCGQIATYYFPYSKKYCCGCNVSKCPEKNKKMVNTRRKNNSYISGAAKGLQTKRTTIGVSGKTILEEAGIKHSKTKTSLEENGKSIAQNAAAKMVKTRRETIDPETGMDLCKLVGKKQKETKDKLIDPETGLNMHQLTGQKSLATNSIKDKTGKNHFDRLSEDVEWRAKLIELGNALHEKRKADIDSSGMDHYARRTARLLKDIDDNGLNAIERAQKKARKGCLRKRYKNTPIHYQGKLELNFLEKLEDKYNLNWLINNVKNGKYIKYWNPVSEAYRYYIPDFIIDKTVYEIKSSYTWNNYGEDANLENINCAKLEATINEGFKVILILDKEETKWK